TLRRRALRVLGERLRKGNGCLPPHGHGQRWSGWLAGTQSSRSSHHRPRREFVCRLRHASGSGAPWSRPTNPFVGTDGVAHRCAPRSDGGASVKPSILIVDDSLTVRMDLSETLAEAGFDTYQASRVSEAELVLNATPIDLLILDVR